MEAALHLPAELAQQVDALFAGSTPSKGATPLSRSAVNTPRAASPSPAAGGAAVRAALPSPAPVLSPPPAAREEFACLALSDLQKDMHLGVAMLGPAWPLHVLAMQHSVSVKVTSAYGAALDGAALSLPCVQQLCTAIDSGCNMAGLLESIVKHSDGIDAAQPSANAPAAVASYDAPAASQVLDRSQCILQPVPLKWPL